MERARIKKKRRAAVKIIEKFFLDYLLKKDLREARKFLAKLPFDCRILWIRMNCIKLQTSSLKGEVEQLIKGRELEEWIIFVYRQIYSCKKLKLIFEIWKLTSKSFNKSGIWNSFQLRNIKAKNGFKNRVYWLLNFLKY